MNKKVSTLVAALMAAGALVLPKDVFAQVQLKAGAEAVTRVTSGQSYCFTFNDGNTDYVAFVTNDGGYNKLVSAPFSTANPENIVTITSRLTSEPTDKGNTYKIETKGVGLGVNVKNTDWHSSSTQVAFRLSGGTVTISRKNASDAVAYVSLKDDNTFEVTSQRSTISAKLYNAADLIWEKAVTPLNQYAELSTSKGYILMVEGKVLTDDGDGVLSTGSYDREDVGQVWNISYDEVEGVVKFTNALSGKPLTDGNSYVTLDASKASDGTLTIAGSFTGNVLGTTIDAIGEAEANSLSTGELNDVNRGSFSLNYQFDNNHKATVNPFDKEIKAFYKDGDSPYIIYLATSWPASANSKDVLTDDEFSKSTFIVANPSDDWNISEFNDFGESSKFIEVKGNRLISGVSNDAESLANLKAGKVAIENAQYFAHKIAGTSEYTFSLNYVFGLSDDEKSVKVSNSSLDIALVDDQQGRLVTTVNMGTAERAGEIELGATITNNRTVTAKNFLSTDKASVFNIKFVSDSQDNESRSEYNKYLTLSDGAEIIAHGSDFTNLDAPESQWIVTSVSGNEYTFQNRENPNSTFDVELLSTDKAGVYELRDADYDSFDTYYVNKESGKYEEGTANINFSGLKAEFIAVTPDAEAGYATTELDNAGLVRLMFESREDNLLASELFVTAEQEDKNQNVGHTESTDISKEESDAAQFTVVKFDAASTATALSDTIYAVNDYAVLKEAGKDDTKIIADGDSIAVVSYAFKQLRADGENYYLSADMQTVVKQNDESKAPRFLVKINKNGSYSLISVGTNDELRDVLTDVNEKTFDLNGASNAIIVQSTSVYYDYADRKYDFNILKETPGTSYNHVPQHVTMEAVNGGYVAMDTENKEGIVAPVSTLRAEYTKEDLIFWLDTADSEAVTPSFMISKAGNYMYNATDSLDAYNDGTASAERVEDFALNVNGSNLPKVIFQSADLTKVEDIENYKFQIVQSPESEDEYIIKSLNGYTYVAAHNQKLYISTNADAALRLTVTPVEAPTANESISATDVKVIALDGVVNVKNAAGKKVVVSTILGQIVANEVLTSDNATISVPAGIAIVSVDGEEAVKVSVK